MADIFALCFSFRTLNKGLLVFEAFNSLLMPDQYNLQWRIDDNKIVGEHCSS